MEREPSHEPVLVSETVGLLDPARGGLFVDCTVGLGGHSRALLEAGASRLIGLDRDRSALALAAESLAPWTDRVDLVHADYRQLGAVLDERGEGAADGLLADLGVSSMQFDTEGRGFSFRRDEPLDMRMDQTQGPTVADLLASAEEQDLADVIFRFGEERFSRRIARGVVEARRLAPVATTGQLAQIVRRAVPRKGYQRIDPATRTFQALRIWVNHELEGLDGFLVEASRRLRAGARLAVITFHSLEDRVVKHTFRALAAGESALRVLTRRPVVPAEAEVKRNPRARSAKLRAIERFA
ncbi:MAG: 16S rRNA (cytosine(1402)-N(4))-methyltransferase RsmH [Acidobacteriota bacterium]|jgi:16S rRNA (cytosine1402-N4)-methyltransferase|nr:16S rRNA (cytosine(1402)-N(4))-methyltransferase RsmH [Acidobacteriota bacterium]